MERICKIFIFTIILFISINSIVFASNEVAENEIKIDGEELEKVVKIRNSNMQSFKENLEQEIEYEGAKYTFDSLKRQEKTNNNSKDVEKEIEIDSLFDTSDKSKILNSNEIAKSLLYDENNFSGDIPLKDIKITTIKMGTYQKIETLDIPFSDASQNELSNIPKEITQNGYKWNLINVDWKAEKTENIDGTLVPISYSGTKHYKRVATYNKPNKYKVTAIYEGKVENKDLEYFYTLSYKKQEEPKKQIDIKKIAVIIGAIGILVILFAIIVARKKKKEEEK